MSKPSIIAPIVLVGSAILFFTSVWGLKHYYLEQLRVPAEIIYGEQLPPELKLLASFKTDDGLTADIYNQNDHTKVGFAFSRVKAMNAQAPSGTYAVRSLILFQSRQTLDPQLTPFTEKYAAAQFDPLRAFDLEPVTMTIAGTQVEAVRFRTTDEWNHLFGIINLPNGQLAFQTVRKNAQVDPATAIAILEKEIAASKSW